MKIIVSGSSRGIGKAIAEKYLSLGHEVIGVDISISSINHPNYTHIQKDIRDKDLPNIDSINIIIANAGVQDEKTAIGVNLEGTINFVEKYINDDLESVLFLASSSARNGSEFPLYSASKGGVVTYMKNLALKLSKNKVTVNSISPGGVITPMNQHILEDKEKYEAVLKETLFKKWSKPEEIAEWAYFLTVINESMTGEDILIDNGEMLKSNFIW